MFQVYVGSVIEVYTTMFGWSLYNTFYNLLSITGLLYFPFLMALYHNWKTPYESQEGKAASVTSQRRMQVAVVSLILVFSLAVLPMVELDLGDISYHKVCSEKGKTVVKKHTSGNEETRYSDNVGADAGVTRIPAYWWFLLAFSSGFNNAAMSSVSCFEDIKGLDQQLRRLTIRDQSLREEYVRFVNECFWPSKARYLDGLKGVYGEEFRDYVVSQYKTIITDDDNTDPFYIGSRLYLQSPGFYKSQYPEPANCARAISKCSFRAQYSVPNWPYYPARDTRHSLADVENGTAGTPYCDEWWESPMNGRNGKPLGLKTKLLNSIERASTDIDDWQEERGVVRNAKRILENVKAHTILSDEKVDKLVISRYVDSEPPPMLDDEWRNSFSSSDGQNSVVVAAMGRLMKLPQIRAAVGVAAATATISIASSLKDFYLTMYILKSAAPFAQAVILMMMYGLMIFYLVVSEYNIESILLMTFLILAVRFFTPLWDIADYLDAKLYVAIYPNLTDQLATLDTQGMNRVILDMVLTVNYIVVPAILLMVMGFAGVKAGKMVSSMDSMNSPLRGLGKAGSLPKPGIGSKR